MPTVVSEVPRSSRTSKHNWPEYADGELREFKLGEDFDAKPNSFASSARTWGTSNGYNVEAHLRGESVYLRFVSQ